MVTANLPETIRFQKRAVATLLREISTTDRVSQSRYIKEFENEFRAFKNTADLSEIIEQAVESNIIYIGDFHGLRESQFFAANFLRRLAESRGNIALGLELFAGRHQRILDLFLNGSIGEEELLDRTRYYSEWRFDWESYAPLLRFARDNEIRCLALDYSPRGDMRMVRRRDSYAASRIADFLSADPKALLCVVFGESHLASNHLPGKVKTRLKKRGLEHRDLVIVQNIDNLYWRLAQQGRMQTSAVQIDENKFCVFNASPFAKYVAYSQSIDQWHSDEPEEDATPTVYRVIDVVLNFLQMDKRKYQVNCSTDRREFLIDLFPEVYTNTDSEAVKYILERHGVKSAVQSQALSDIKEKGSAYVSQLNAIFVQRMDVIAIAESVSVFLQNAMSGRIYSWSDSASELDRFYALIVKEALADFTVSLVSSQRNVIPITMRAQNLSEDEMRKLNRFVLSFEQLHSRREQRATPYVKLVKRLIPRLVRPLARILGRQLGQTISSRFNLSEQTRAELRRAFAAVPSEENDALKVYLRLN